MAIYISFPRELPISISSKANALILANSFDSHINNIKISLCADKQNLNTFAQKQLKDLSERLRDIL